MFRNQACVILAIDGVQPHKGHEILWVVRDCLSGEDLLATALLSATFIDLMGLLMQVKQILAELGPEPAAPSSVIRRNT